MVGLNKVVLAGSVLLLLQGAAFAQSTPATPAPAPAASSSSSSTMAAKPAKTKMSATDKAALSKKCSVDADAKNLHGKAREKFRSDCKKNGA